MIVPIIAEVPEERQPIIAEAVPARWPMGSMAKALRLPKSIPRQKNVIRAKVMNCQRAIW